jgi:putative thioredoxin
MTGLKADRRNSYIFNADLDNFGRQVIEQSHNKPVLVDFWADWCSPCIVIAPILEKIINERDGEVLLAKLEVDDGENMKLAGQYQVRGFPTVILFRNGEEQGRFSGARPAHEIDAFIDSHSEG